MKDDNMPDNKQCKCGKERCGIKGCTMNGEFRHYDLYCHGNCSTQEETKEPACKKCGAEMIMFDHVCPAKNECEKCWEEICHGCDKSITNGKCHGNCSPINTKKRVIAETDEGPMCVGEVSNGKLDGHKPLDGCPDHLQQILSVPQHNTANDMTYCSKIPGEHPATDCEEGTWREDFQNKFGNYGLYKDMEYMKHEDAMAEVEEFISTQIKATEKRATDRITGMREKLAELEHNQWAAWSTEIARKEHISEERHQRWFKLWIPYKDLPEKEKAHDRVWADKVIEALIKIL